MVLFPIDRDTFEIAIKGVFGVLLIIILILVTIFGYGEWKKSCNQKSSTASNQVGGNSKGK